MSSSSSSSLFRRVFSRRNVARFAVGSAVTSATSIYLLHRWVNSHGIQYPTTQTTAVEIKNSDIPSRDKQINKLKENTQVFDILVIGGGATGTGVALDAISRGLSVALVERDDYSSGTSSRSTKLIHGGVRYLEKAFTSLDKGQLDLVQDALRERRHLINISPHLSRPLPIIVPVYDPFPLCLFTIPYYYIGIKAYDFFAGDDGLLEPSYWLSYQQVRERFPMLKKEGLRGGIVYFDGQHNDSRMNLGIALTAAARGAVTANHVEVVDLIKEGDRVIGAHVKDNLSGDSWPVYAKSVVNATGPFCDAVRKMADEKKKSLITPSSGVHVVLSGQYCPEGMGLIIPKTEDGRVLFALPWEGSTVIGTTDEKCDLTALPKPRESEIQFILKEVSRFLNHQVKREDVDAAWSGIRPLAVDPHAKDTASTSRDHMIEKTAPGVITITGGKWTTYRKMAEDTVDSVLEENKKLKKESETKPELSKYIIDTSKITPSNTIGVPLIGAAGWSLQLPTTLHRLGFDNEVSQHLAHNYGDKAFEVAQIATREPKLAGRLAAGYPFIEAEVIYCCRHEYATTATDMIANRMRLSFLNSDATIFCLPRIINLMAKELGWDETRKIIEYQNANKFISTMNRKGVSQHVIVDPQKQATIENKLRQVFDRIPFNADEIQKLHDLFNSLDKDQDGHLSRSEVIELANQTELFGLEKAQVEGGQALNKQTQKFLDQLSLLDRDDKVSWEPFLFSVAASFHSFTKDGSKNDNQQFKSKEEHHKGNSHMNLTISIEKKE